MACRRPVALVVAQVHHREPVNLKATKDLATWVMVLLITQIALDLIQWLALLHRIDVLERIRSGSGTVTPVQANAADGAVSAAAGIGSLVFIATVVLWCIWQHRAQQNAIVLAGGGLRFTPGWAVGWWFIPFANLVKPFQTVRELWKASQGARWREIPTWPLLGWWWGIWLAANVHVWFGSSGFGVGIGSEVGSPTTIGNAISRDQWELLSLVLEIAAAVLAVVIVRSIEQLQQAATGWTPPAGALAGPPLPAPPPPRPV